MASGFSTLSGLPKLSDSAYHQSKERPSKNVNSLPIQEEGKSRNKPFQHQHTIRRGWMRSWKNALLRWEIGEASGEQLEGVKCNTHGAFSPTTGLGEVRTFAWCLHPTL